MDPDLVALHTHIANLQGAIYLNGTDRAGVGGLVETNVLNAERAPGS